MKGLETGKDKVKKICEILKKETLEPAQKEAELIVEHARQEADKITEQAQAQARQMLDQASAEIAKERNVFQSSLLQASKQAIAALKQDIEERLLNPALSRILSETMNDKQVVSHLIQTIIQAIKDQGVDADLSAYVSKMLDPRDVNSLLTKDALDNLREKSVVIGPMQAGVSVKIHDQNVTIDASDKAVKELISQFIRKDFRELFFLLQ
jgi:V/A-type H+-transporting ATPase subunit E